MTKHPRESRREAMVSRLTNTYRLRKLSALRNSTLISREAMAATLIQTVWKTKFKHITIKALATKFLDPAYGTPINWVKSLEGGFETLVVELRSQARIDVAKDFLRRVHILANKRYGNIDMPQSVSVRVFLAGYMIAFWRSEVFEDIEAELERTLFECTVPLMELVETIATQLAAHGSFLQVTREHTAAFQDTMKTFLVCFKRWKVPDGARISKRIINALIALEGSEAELPDDETQDSQLRDQIATQIVKLRGKLLAIAGPKALAEYDATQEPLRKCIREGQAARADGMEGDVARYTNDKMSNEQLAHELLLDPTFRIDIEGNGPFKDEVWSSVRKNFHEKFWEGIVDDLTITPPIFVRCVRVIAEIRDGLSECAAEARANVTPQHIKEVFDIALINQMVRQRIFDWDYFQKLISSAVGFVRRIQVPAHDADLTSKWNALRSSMEQPDANRNLFFSKALEFMLDRVNIIRIDLANSRLRLVAPVMINHGIGYEQDKFQARVDSGVLTLQHTTNWIKESVARETTSGAIRLQDLLAGRFFQQLHAASILSLIVSPLPIQGALMPETLLMDRDRITWFRSEYNRVIDSSSVLVSVSYNLIGSTPTAQKQLVLLELSRLIVENLGKRFSIADAFCKFDEAIEYAGYIISADEKARICKAVEASLAKENPVRKLIADRVCKAWTAYVKAPAPIGESQFINSARLLIPHIEKLASKLHKFTTVNCNVHANLYNRLIAEAARAVGV